METNRSERESAHRLQSLPERPDVVSRHQGHLAAGRPNGTRLCFKLRREKAAYIYLTATLDAAIWGAELALGDGPGRIYIVEPTGPIEDDPNLTDKKFPGNPTKSYRSRNPLRIIGEVTDWQGHSPEQLNAMKEHLERLKQLGIEAIED